MLTLAEKKRCIAMCDLAAIDEHVARIYSNDEVKANFMRAYMNRVYPEREVEIVYSTSLNVPVEEERDGT